MSSSVPNIINDCDCCTIDNCNLGVSNLEKISEKNLKDILKEESGGKRQKVANNLKAQNERILKHIFNLGEGFEKSNDRRFTFNNLAMDKLRKDNDRTSDLGKIMKSMNTLLYLYFQPNYSAWAMEIRCLTTLKLLICY